MDTKIRIGEWRVDPQSGQVADRDRSIYVKPMLMRLLIYLAHNAGQVVSQKRLIEEVWAGVHVTQDALTHSISELRKVLGDSARNSSIISTVPKRGYKLIAPVTIEGEEKKSAGKKVLRFAVLPFENLSNEAEGERFAQGMSDLLITHLAKVDAIRVISRTAAMGYDKSRTLTAQSSPEHDVDRILEGTVVQAEGRVRVTARLLGRDDEYLWAEIYEQDLADVLQLQQELAVKIIQEVLKRPGGV